MARKQLAEAEAAKTAAAAAAAADPFQPAPSGSGRLHSAQQYAKFATQTEEWEARNKTRKELLYEALERHDKRRKNKYTTQFIKFQLLFILFLFLYKNKRSKTHLLYSSSFSSLARSLKRTASSIVTAGSAAVAANPLPSTA